MALTLQWDNEARGSFAVSNGWMANAERLLADLPEAPEHARLLLIKALAAMFAAGRLRARDRALRRGVRARDPRRRSRRPDARALGKGPRARSSSARSTPASRSSTRPPPRRCAATCAPTPPGSSTASRSAPARTSATTGAQPSGRRRANRFCDKLDVSGFPGACRIHRAEVLRLRGDWSAAEAQAMAACEELHDFDRSITAFGHYEIGEIRRRRGDFAGSGRGVRHLERDGPRAPARALAAPARRRQDRCRSRRDLADAAGRHGSALPTTGASRHRSRSRSRPEI